MTKLTCATLSLSLAALSALPAMAQAQDGGVRLNLGTSLGVGGKYNVEFDEDVAEQTDAPDLTVTPGVFMGAELPLHQYFTLGGEVGLSFWSVEERDGMDNGDRQLQLDLTLRPKVRYSVLPELELYGVVPVGFSYYVPRDQLKDAGVNGGPGFAIGGGAGATYFVTESIGLNAELGYLYHANYLSVDGAGDAGDYTGSFGQFQARAGVSFAF